MARSIKFFASQNDLLDLFNGCFEEGEVVFVNYSNGINLIFNDIIEYGELGYTKYPEHYSENLLIIPADKANQIGDVRVYTGEIEGAVRLIPGGFYEENILIHGLVDTVYSEKENLKIYNDIAKKIRKKFVCQKGYYIGKEVYSKREEIRFVTMGVNSPKEYDLQVK